MSESENLGQSNERPSRAFRRSIWQHDSRYGLNRHDVDQADLETISRLSSVDAAKKIIPAIPPVQLLAISKAAKSMPSAKTTTKDHVAGFLGEGKKHFGAGIPTLICMLAVESDGAYAPMDRKVAAGLLKLKKITPDDLTALTKGTVEQFSGVYVSKVLPVWTELRRERSAEDADNYLGSSA